MRGLAPPQNSLQLPAGTVTFLLSDIEGSTRLWERHPEAMAVAVARHYELIVAAVARRGGVLPVEQGEGDSVVAAFARASDGLCAALEAQLALCAETWPEGAEVRVRIALHTAEGEPSDPGIYRGVALSRCARLRAIAQGGQTLLSGTTRDLVAERLPKDVELVALGRHRLRDLSRSEDVFCVMHPDLPRDFPPLRSLDGPPNNLPPQWSSFIGRERELDEVQQGLRASRLLTLTGPGGCGKTRLAIQAATEALERFPDGAWWVELAPITDPKLVGPAVAKALGVRSLPGRSDLDAAAAYLHRRRALVVLDNSEHLLEHAASVALALLQGCDHLTLLATSRRPLNLPGETDWRVPSLSVPTEADATGVEELKTSDAPRLFIERARKVRPDFRGTRDNAPAIVQICRELDGIPLAIELAAARVRLLSVNQIANGLSDRFRLLTSGPRTALPRQRTLRASVDWSHQLLSDGERTLLRRLAVFVGGFSLDAAEDVCCGGQLASEHLLDLLGSLVENSLVQTEPRGSNMRYWLLETVRQYALERLLEAGELEGARDRHRDACLEFAECVAPKLLTPRQTEWLDRLDAEAGNLAAAVDWATRSDPQKALRLCAALTMWWNLRGQYASAEGGFRGALEAADDTPSSLHARVLWGRALLLTYAGEYERAIDSARQGLAEAEGVGDQSTAARVLWVIGTIQMLPDPRGSRPGVERGRELASASGDEWALAWCDHVLAFSHLFQENRAEALSLLEEAFSVFERLGYEWSLAFHWIALVLAHYAPGEHERCREFAERASIAARKVGEPNSEGLASALVVMTEIDAGRGDDALERAMTAREQAVARGAGLALPWIETCVGTAHAARGALEDAVSTLGAIVEVGANGVLHALAWAEVALADVLRLQGDRSGAASHAGRVLELMNHLENPWFGARARLVIGRLGAARSSWSEAESLHHQALEAIMDHGFHLELPGAIEALGEVAHGLESDEEATRLLGAAHRVRREFGFVAWNPQRHEVEVLTERVREALGAPAFDVAFEQGTELAPEEAVAWLRRARGSRKRPSGGWESLTPTELEVLRHTAQGLTNPEIAERMFISRGTVKVHLSHIYAKLGIRNRTELTREAARRLRA
jgi:predicted ATPase/class 3 adenylate cyclase/DNA-binding CsgD family transcriptional regulator